MLFSTHAIVGAAVGIMAQDPVWGFAAGFISHHVLDALPHFDQGSFYIEKSAAPYLRRGAGVPHHNFSRRDWIILFADWIVSGTVFIFLLMTLRAGPAEYIIAGALGGLSPDIIDSSPLWSKKLRAKIRAVLEYHRFHSYFHWTVARKNMPLGLITQIFLVTVSLLYLTT